MANVSRIGSSWRMAHGPSQGAGLLDTLARHGGRRQSGFIGSGLWVAAIRGFESLASPLSLPGSRIRLLRGAYHRSAQVSPVPSRWRRPGSGLPLRWQRRGQVHGAHAGEPGWLGPIGRGGQLLRLWAISSAKGGRGMLGWFLTGSLAAPGASSRSRWAGSRGSGAGWRWSRDGKSEPWPSTNKVALARPLPAACQHRCFHGATAVVTDRNRGPPAPLIRSPAAPVPDERGAAPLAPRCGHTPRQAKIQFCQRHSVPA